MSNEQLDALAEAIVNRLHAAGRCPAGLSEQDVADLKAFAAWWRDTKKTVNGCVIKLVLTVFVGALILLGGIKGLSLFKQ